MENLLLDLLPQYNGWKRWVNALSMVANKLPFTLYDVVSCKACSNRNMHCGNEVVARFSVTGGHEVVSIAIEEYLLEPVGGIKLVLLYFSKSCTYHRFNVTFARKDNSLRINRLFGLLENWVTR